MPASLEKITAFCDELLRTKEIEDYSAAHNGLQVENDGRVRRIVAAVDSHEKTIEAAISMKADLLIVHHGLFWSDPIPFVGANYRRIRLCVENNLAVYSSHLPLDLHPKIGNNILLARALGLRNMSPFCQLKGRAIGVQGILDTDLAKLADKLDDILGGEVRVIAGGPKKIHRVGIVTGGAGGEIPQAIEEGVDVFITGEGPHWTFGLALEGKMNLIYGGHYATETFGVQALASLLAKKFKLPWDFIDIPSGL